MRAGGWEQEAGPAGGAARSAAADSDVRLAGSFRFLPGAEHTWV